MNKNKNIFGYAQIQEIYRFQEQYFSNRDMNSYLENCYEYVGKCFLEMKGDSFLSNKGYYFNRDILEVIDYSKNPSWQEHLIKAGELMMKEGELVSISKSLFDTEVTGALLYHGELPNEPYIKDINSFDISLFKFNEEINSAETQQANSVEEYVDLIKLYYSSIKQTQEYNNAIDQFLNGLIPDKERTLYFTEDKEIYTSKGGRTKLELVLLIYKLIYDKIKQEKEIENFYAYFVRPVNLQIVYSGVLLLMLSTPLSANEYADTAFMLTSILSNTATEITKNEEWRQISDEQSHAFKHAFGALAMNIKEFKVSTAGNKKAKLYAEKAFLQVETLNKINQFLLNLMRAGLHGENLQKIDKHRSKKLERKNISIKSTLQKVLETLSTTLDLLGLSEDHHEENITNLCIPNILKDIGQIDDVKVNVIPIGLEIILTELLKNAIFNTDSEKPLVRIFISKMDDSDYYSLHITNNEPITKDNLKYIKKLQKVSGVAKQYKAGIRVVWRIINFPLFNKSNTLWKLDVNEDCINSNETDIILKIHKEDIT